MTNSEARKRKEERCGCGTEAPHRHDAFGRLVLDTPEPETLDRLRTGDEAR